MSIRHKLVLVVLGSAFPFFSTVAFATNGTFMPGYGVQSMSMGGVGIASGQDAMSAAANPANLSYVGMRGDIDLTAFNPRVKAYVRCGGPFSFGCYNNTLDPMGWVNSDSSLYWIPNMAMSMPLTEKFSAGLGFIAASGMGTSYNPNFFSFNGSTTPPDNANLGIQLMQMIVPVTLAYKPAESQSFGFSMVPAIQRFNASGLDAFKAFGISIDSSHMSGQGNDYSYGLGAKIGWIGKFLDNKVSIGATYASKISMSKFDKYRGLFPNHGEFDIPANFGFGLALRPTEQWLFAFDVNKIMYKEVAAFGNPGPSLIGTTPNVVSLGTNPAYNCTGATPSPYCLGQPDGMGFGWKNQTVYKFGVAYKTSPNLTLKAGMNYAHTPIRNEMLTFNLLAPATTERHYSVGMTYSVNENLDVSALYMRAMPNSQSQSRLQVIGAGGFAMNQNYFGVGLSWVLDRPSK